MAICTSRVIKIRVKDSRTFTIHHKMMSITISMGTLTCSLQAPLTEVSGFNIVFGLAPLKQTPRQLGHGHAHCQPRGSISQVLSRVGGLVDEGPRLRLYHWDPRKKENLYKNNYNTFIIKRVQALQHYCIAHVVWNQTLFVSSRYTLKSSKRRFLGRF